MTVVDKAPPVGKKDAFVYFDTEEKQYAPKDALEFSKLMGIETVDSKENAGQFDKVL